MASTQDAPAAAASVDGRLARSARTRRAIVDALRALHAEGELRPTAPRVAERAGVGVRTVWQHFDDLEALFVEAGARDLEVARSFVTPIDPDGPLPERVQALVRQRAEMFEALAPVWRAARLHEPFSPQIRANRDQLVALGREQLSRVFARELAPLAPAVRRTRLDALAAVTNWALWESLRTELGLDAAAARRTVLALVLPLLTEET